MSVRMQNFSSFLLFVVFFYRHSEFKEGIFRNSITCITCFKPGLDRGKELILGSFESFGILIPLKCNMLNFVIN